MTTIATTNYNDDNRDGDNENYDEDDDDDDNDHDNGDDHDHDNDDVMITIPVTITITITTTITVTITMTIMITITITMTITITITITVTIMITITITVTITMKKTIITDNSVDKDGDKGRQINHRFSVLSWSPFFRVQLLPSLNQNGIHNTSSPSCFVECSINPVSPRLIKYLRTPLSWLHFLAGIKTR